jgi:hypothetical protein
MQIAEEGGTQPHRPGCVVVRWHQSIVLVHLGVLSSGALSWAHGSPFLLSLATAPFLVAVVPFLPIAVALPSLSLLLSWSSSLLLLLSSSWVVIHAPVPVSTLRALRVLATAVGGAEGGSRHGGGGLVPRCLSPLPSLMPRSSPLSFHGRLHPRTSLCPASRCSQRRSWVLSPSSWVAGPSSLLSCHRRPLHCCRRCRALAGCPPLLCSPRHHPGRPGRPRRCSPCR